MGTTTNYAIPYPEPTDFVTDGATAMESIAEKVDDILSTGAAARNLLYNGAMQISQRAAVGTTVTGITTENYYTADRWSQGINAIGTWSQVNTADAPTGSGFRNSLKVTCTTANASPTAPAYHYIQQKLEGQDCQAIKKGTASAQSLTLSFWVKAGLSGTYIAEIMDEDNSFRFVSKAYTINATNTWEFKTISIPADTTGVLDNDNGNSLTLRLYLGAGSNYTSGTLQTTWGTYTAANRAVGQVNLGVGNNSSVNYWQMTGAQLTVGSVSTPFEFKSYQTELRECQRYYYRRSQVGGYNHVEGIPPGVNFNNGFFFQCLHPYEMRAAPVYSLVSGGTAVDAYGVASGITYSSQQMTTKGGRISFTTAGLVDYRLYFFIGNADVTVQFSAEL